METVGFRFSKSRPMLGCDIVRRERMSSFINAGVMIMLMATGLAGVLPAAATHQAVSKSDAPASRWGYVEYLPSTYHDNPGAELPLIVFMHGIGERGSGEDAAAVWKSVTRAGPHRLIRQGSTYFDEHSVILCSPQTPDNWFADHIDEFVSFCVNRYRVDESRIYITGLSLGGGGVWRYGNAYPERVAACLPVCGAVGASVTDSFDDVPVWAFHSWNDSVVSRNNSIGWVNAIAGSLSGVTQTDVMGSGYLHENDDYRLAAEIDMTAVFSVPGGWTWSGDTPSQPPTTSPILTMYESGGHNAWTRTYNNMVVWDWLLSQRKGGVGVDDPSIVVAYPPEGQRSVSAGEDAVWAVRAVDVNGQALSGSSITWSSNVAGVLGTGSSVQVSGLAYGTHLITVVATDSEGRRGTTTFPIQVYRPTAYVARYDIGEPGSQSAGFYNNISEPVAGSVTNSVDIDGQQTGVTVRVSQAFDGRNNYGVNDDSVFDVSAQIDNFYLDRDVASTSSELTFSNLNPNRTYQLVCFASRSGSNNYVTRYRVGSQSGALSVDDNTDRTVILNDLTPTADGQFTLIVEVEDGAGRYAHLGAIELRTSAGGLSEPKVQILNPDDGAHIKQGSSLSFLGKATDQDDGVLSSGIEWVSSIDGPFGTGANLNVSSLSLGDHWITASVVDSDGATAEQSLLLSVLPSGADLPVRYGQMMVTLSGFVEDDVATLIIDGQEVELSGRAYSATLAVYAGQTEVPVIVVTTAGAVVTKVIDLSRLPSSGS